MAIPKQRFYEKGWFGIPVIIAGTCAALGIRKLGLDGEFKVFALGFALYAFLSLRWPRLWPWMHRSLRAGFRLDDPEQKRLAGLPEKPETKGAQVP